MSSRSRPPPVLYGLVWFLSWPFTLPQGSSSCTGSSSVRPTRSRTASDRPPMRFVAPPALTMQRIHFPEDDRGRDPCQNGYRARFPPGGGCAVRLARSRWCSYCPTADGSVVVLERLAPRFAVSRAQAASPPVRPRASRPTRGVPTCLRDGLGTEVPCLPRADAPSARELVALTDHPSPASRDPEIVVGWRRTGVRSRREPGGPGRSLAPPLAGLDAPRATGSAGGRWRAAPPVSEDPGAA